MADLLDVQVVSLGNRLEWAEDQGLAVDHNSPVHVLCEGLDLSNGVVVQLRRDKRNRVRRWLGVDPGLDDFSTGGDDRDDSSGRA